MAFKGHRGYEVLTHNSTGAPRNPPNPSTDSDGFLGGKTEDLEAWSLPTESLPGFFWEKL